MAAPIRRTISGSHVAAMAMPQGKTVAGPPVPAPPPRTPMGPSHIPIAGRPSRSMAFVPKPVPPSNDSFSSKVKRPSRSATRASSGALGSWYGGGVSAAHEMLSARQTIVHRHNARRVFMSRRFGRPRAFSCYGASSMGPVKPGPPAAT